MSAADDTMVERRSSTDMRWPLIWTASCCMSATSPAMCGEAWLVPDWYQTAPSGSPSAVAPQIWPPGAKTVVIAVLRCENEMIRSGPVEKSWAPVDHNHPPVSRSHTAPIDQALGSEEGKLTP